MKCLVTHYSAIEQQHYTLVTDAWMRGRRRDAGVCRMTNLSRSRDHNFSWELSDPIGCVVLERIASSRWNEDTRESSDNSNNNTAFYWIILEKVCTNSNLNWPDTKLQVATQCVDDVIGARPMHDNTANALVRLRRRASERKTVALNEI